MAILAGATTEVTIERSQDRDSDNEHGGASANAIRAHYDVGNDFFRLWLDLSMTYSCAAWAGTESLEEAQAKKLDLHIDQAKAAGAGRVLDIGCGWGSLLNRLVQRGANEVVGLTLSRAQADFVRSLNLSGTTVVVEDWRDHVPASPYDALISIGAIEHFVKPLIPSEQRIEIYREFFSRCRSWLGQGRWMSIQTIAYGSGRFRSGAIASIFPESDLPQLNELLLGIEGKFELVSLRNDRLDYARTCRSWLERLRANRAAAVALVGEQTSAHYEAFLAASERGFTAGVFQLFRIQLRRIDG